MESEALVLNFDEKPRAIVTAMDRLRDQARAIRVSARGTRRIPVGLVVLGFALFFIDRSVGYPSRIFTLPSIALVVLGFWTSVKVRRTGRQPTYRHPGFAAARVVIHTLRDDLAPKRNLHGTLDLTGVQSEGKLGRKTEDSRGRSVSYYRDDWLTMKAKLYDGSMLRFSVIHRLKVRDSYWKRGAVSGKRKLKPAVVKSDTQWLDVRVTANPMLYSVVEARAPTVGQTVGNCRIDSVTIDGALLRVRASGPTQPTSEDILGVLLLTYGTLQRKDAA